MFLVDNDKIVKHCSFAIIKTPTVSTIRKSQYSKKKASINRKTLASGITGLVVWFNVCKGYGFIHVTIRTLIYSFSTLILLKTTQP